MSEASNLQFVDANILIYAHGLSSEQKHARARGPIHATLIARQGKASTETVPASPSLLCEPLLA